MNGILIIDKPVGLTSHDVVSRLRRILKTKRIGHTGTLDPFATGVLVMLVGKATRLARFLDKDAKEYEAIVRFGFETDTGDRTGELRITNYELRDLSDGEIKDVLADFRGEILQTPPMYSAKKVEGRKLYDLARKGIEIEREAVKVSIYELEMIESGRWSVGSGQLEGEDQKPKTKDRKPTTDHRPLSTDHRLPTTDHALRVVCSAGTYIRTLAEDIGRKLETGAHLAELRRTRAGRFDLSQAVTIEELEIIAAEDKLNEILISMNDAVSHLPQAILTETEIEDTRNGKRLRFENAGLADNQSLRMTDAADNLIAIGFYKSDEKFIQPKLVLI